VSASSILLFARMPPDAGAEMADRKAITSKKSTR